MHFFHFCIALFQVAVVMFFESNPPYKFNNREKDLQIAKIWLESNQKDFAKVSKQKSKEIRKIKRKKNRKRKKGQQHHFGLVTKMAHGPLSPSPRTGTKSPASCR
jgi:hypothetical protein